MSYDGLELELGERVFHFARNKKRRFENSPAPGEARDGGHGLLFFHDPALDILNASLFKDWLRKLKFVFRHRNDRKRVPHLPGSQSKIESEAREDADGRAEHDQGSRRDAGEVKALRDPRANFHEAHDRHDIEEAAGEAEQESFGSACRGSAFGFVAGRKQRRIQGAFESDSDDSDRKKRNKEDRRAGPRMFLREFHGAQKQQSFEKADAELRNADALAFDLGVEVR